MNPAFLELTIDVKNGDVLREVSDLHNAVVALDGAVGEHWPAGNLILGTARAIAERTVSDVRRRIEISPATSAPLAAFVAATKAWCDEKGITPTFGDPIAPCGKGVLVLW